MAGQVAMSGHWPLKDSFGSHGPCKHTPDDEDDEDEDELLPMNEDADDADDVALLAEELVEALAEELVESLTALAPVELNPLVTIPYWLVA